MPMLRYAPDTTSSFRAHMEQMCGTPPTPDLCTAFLLQEEVPFAHPVAKYPVSKRAVTLPTFADRKEVNAAHAPYQHS